MKLFKLVILLACGILTGFCANAQTQRINIPVKGLYPEGTAFNPKNNLFYIGSETEGTIGTVDMDGNYKVFYADNALKSTYGMKINSKQNRLWVCVSDANNSKFSDSTTFKKMGRVIAIDLSSRKKVADINLSQLYPGKHFINDLAFDDKGNIYLTDSFSPVIYKVDAGGRASVFVQSDIFKGSDIGLNGIAYNPDGYLIVDNDREGALYKIPVGDPSNITKVMVKEFFPGSDGLILTDKNTLVLIQNKSVDKVFQLNSNDGWSTAKVTASTKATDRFQQPSAGAFANGKLYVLNSKTNELSDKTKKPSPSFSLQLVVFNPVQ